MTGGGDGIGRGIARRFAAEGAKVLIAEIDPSSGTAAADELSAEFGTEARGVPTDVSDKAAVLAMVEDAKGAWGTVDILVNNAWGGAGGLGRVERRSDEDMAAGMAVGFYGPRGDEVIDEGGRSGDGFLAEVSVAERNLLGRGFFGKVSVQYGQYTRGFGVSFVDPYFLGYRVAHPESLDRPQL